MTPVFCCGFECGQTGSVGQHWGTPGNGSFSTSTVRSGARSMRLNPTAAAGAIALTTSITLTTVAVARFYIYFASLPIADTPLLFQNSTSGPGIIFKQSDSKLYIGRFTGGVASVASASGVTVTTGQWYLIDYRINSTSNPWTEALTVNGTEVTFSNAVAGSTPTQFTLGAAGFTATYDIFFDDFILSQTNADYPIGAGSVQHFVPTSDGAHTATTTTIVKGTIAAPTAGGNVAGSTDVFNWVNGVPLLGGATDNTRLVNQQTAGITLYAEVIFGPAPGISTPTVAPRAVEVITADREATTATCDFTAKLNDNGTENTIIARGVVAGVITDRYATKQYATPPTGGAWKVVSGAGNFNNIRARWGYASDATPDLYWRGIMIEAEFAAVAGGSLLPFCIAPQGTR